MTEGVAQGVRPTSSGALHLRPEVHIKMDRSSAVIQFALWEVEVPARVLKNSEGLRRLLTDRRAGGDITFDAQEHALLTLLDAQGCFLPKPGSSSFADALALFLPHRSILYSDYYGHPLWSRLRDGSASPGELTTWAVHNYHISRSAGAIAARRSVHSCEDGLQEFYRGDALEEFWHCDAFYFMDGPGLTLHAEEVKAYVPLPGSTAFEDLALRTAEEDALGHLLIAFYQESSILFQNDCNEFYDSVERSYGIGGFFAGWRRHMSLDIEESHSDNLRALFRPDKKVDPASLTRSVRRVQLAAYYLRAALDETSWYTGTNPQDALTARSPNAVCAADQGIQAGVGSWPSSSASVAGAWLRSLHEASFRCLAFARDHHSIINAGRLAQVLEKATGVGHGPDPLPTDPWAAAVRNYLVERATNWTKLSALTGMIIDTAVLAWPGSQEWRDLGRRLKSLINPPDTESDAVDAARLAELLRLSLSGAKLPPLTLVASNSVGAP